MSTKRTTPKASGAATPASPLWTALLLLGAVAYGLRVLVLNGRVAWPPDQLLASLGTVAGCLALVGPIILFRRTSGDGGVGDLVWLAGGLLVWVYDLAALTRMEWRGVPWATPLGAQAMGLTTLAIILAGRQWRKGSANWSWTNVVGWSLGVFWVAAAVISMAPTRTLLLSLR